ncbi:DNA-binding transcriptional ArsR family regulator [Arthrobacter sp. GAS37]|uniref:hypothetical protein n=1 Tax=Arthrobacter sp. GAS37 TaxID=3156261 RepID=UPI003837BDD3
MPRVFLPGDQVSDDLSYALEVFSLPARVVVLVELMRDGPLLRADLIERLGMESVMVGRTLGALEGLGIVDVNLPAGRRRGRSVTYSVDAEAYTKAATTLARFLALE